MTKTILLLLLTVSTATFAQKRQRSTDSDDTYNTRRSLMEVETKPVDLNLPGKYFKRAGSSLIVGVVFGILGGVGGAAISQSNPNTGRILYFAGGLFTLGGFISAASNLNKGGQELDKALMRKQDAQGSRAVPGIMPN